MFSLKFPVGPFFLISFLVLFSAQSLACPNYKLNSNSLKDGQKMIFMERISLAHKECSVSSLFECTKGRSTVSQPVIYMKRNYILFNVTCSLEKPSVNFVQNQPQKKFREDVKTKGDKDMSDQISSSVGVDTKMDSEILEMITKEKIPPIIFKRAYKNFLKNKEDNKSKRSCFMAGDMTTPEMAKMWLICLKPKKIIPLQMPLANGEGEGCMDHPNISAGRCAKFFGDKPNYCLSAGGNYITSRVTRSIGSKRKLVELVGLDSTNNNAHSRRVGIMQAVDGQTGLALKKEDIKSQGSFVLPAQIKEFGMEDLGHHHESGPVAMYVYPSVEDIKKLSEGDKSVYWNPSCLTEIKKPAWIGRENSFLDERTLEKEQQKFIDRWTQ